MRWSYTPSLDMRTDAQPTTLSDVYQVDTPAPDNQDYFFTSTRVNALDSELRRTHDMILLWYKFTCLRLEIVFDANFRYFEVFCQK